MAKEYKTLTFEDTLQGRQEMAQEIDLLSNQGWELKSKEVTQQGWDFGKTCCFGVLFLPLALLGKKENVIQVIMEREKQDSLEKQPLDNIKEYKGYNGTLTLTDTEVIIKPSLRGSEAKATPYSNIEAVQLEKAGLTAGYLRLTLKGGNGAKAGLFQSTRNKNSIGFYDDKNKEFEEARALIEQRIKNETKRSRK